MKKLRIAAIVAATGLAVVLPASFEAAKAGIHRFGGHALFHAFRHNHNHGQFGAGSWYGGYAESAPYMGDEVGYAPQQQSVVYVAPPPAAALACHHSQETVAVPVEGGGTRDIHVTRC
jgi:hypothetical protein